MIRPEWYRQGLRLAGKTLPPKAPLRSKNARDAAGATPTHPKKKKNNQKRKRACFCPPTTPGWSCRRQNSTCCAFVTRVRRSRRKKRCDSFVAPHWKKTNGSMFWLDAPASRSRIKATFCEGSPPGCVRASFLSAFLSVRHQGCKNHPVPPRSTSRLFFLCRSEFLNEAFTATQVTVNGNGTISISKNGKM